jgi:hypothetical protein
MAENADPAFPISLSPAHANALASRLRVLEEDCREVERYLNGLEGICFEYPDTISESAKRAAKATLKEFLRRLAALQRGLGLRKQRIDLRNLLNARLSHMWVTLHESKAESIRGYGALPDEVRMFLDPRIDQLLKLRDQLRHALRNEK